ncbi:unnamed protein product, partial [Iphiclides podalirius]
MMINDNRSAFEESQGFAEGTTATAECTRLDGNHFHCRHHCPRSPNGPLTPADKHSRNLTRECLPCIGRYRQKLFTMVEKR